LSALTANAKAEEFFIDDGDVTALVNAMNAADANDEPDTIHLAANGTYTLTLPSDSGVGLPRVDSIITIEGNGALIERSGDPKTPTFRFFMVVDGSSWPDSDGDLTINHLTLDSGSSNNGGAIRNWSGAVTIIDCTIANNTASNVGGAIHCDSGGIVTVTNSTLSGNTAGRGGAINKHGSGGAITITDSTIADNIATGNDGGGIHFEFGTLTITGSTISGNATLTHSGGGIRHNAGTLHITNSTISGNSANNSGGGIYNNNAMLNMIHCTVTNNMSGSDGGGILSTGTNFTMTNCIVANSSGGADVQGQPYNDVGYNIVEDGSYVTDPTSTSGDPMLGPLADNGGPTMTHALLPGSPAIDAGDCNGGEITEDQRGEPRPQGAACDVGAFESEAVACPADFDGSGTVDVADLLSLLSAWGTCDRCAQDINNNGTVDVADLLDVLSAWGPC